VAIGAARSATRPAPRGDLAPRRAAGPVPTTLVAQIDSAIGGKTGVDLAAARTWSGIPSGRDHRDRHAFLRTLPERQRRAALGEAVKMAALGDERLFALLEREGAAIARGDLAAFESGAVAELVERAAWAKVRVTDADEHEQEAPKSQARSAGQSQKVKGKILSIGEEWIFVDVGGKAEGRIATAELKDAEGNLTVKEGDTNIFIADWIDRSGS
jgi:hypothetical protein